MQRLGLPAEQTTALYRCNAGTTGHSSKKSDIHTRGASIVCDLRETEHPSCSSCKVSVSEVSEKLYSCRPALNRQVAECEMG